MPQCKNGGPRTICKCLFFLSVLGVPKNETQVLRFGPEYPNQLSHLAGPLLVVVSFSFCLKAVTVTREIRLGM